MSTEPESLFALVLTVCSQDSETRSGTGHNGLVQTNVCSDMKGA
jgi:hypothetical protein